MNKEEVIAYLNQNYVRRDVFSKVVGQYINDKDVAIAAINSNYYLYHVMPESFRGDPEILRVAIEKTSFPSNPIITALPSALTKENILLAIDKNFLETRHMTPEMLSDKDIIRYISFFACRPRGNDLLYTK